MDSAANAQSKLASSQSFCAALREGAKPVLSILCALMNIRKAHSLETYNTESNTSTDVSAAKGEVKHTLSARRMVGTPSAGSPLE